MNLDIAGAIFLWILMLWPIIVVIGYYMSFRPQVSNAPALGLISTVIGYFAMIGTMEFVDTFISPWIDLGLFGGLLYLIVPIVTTHALALVVSKKLKVSN
jgi:hypothetical protein